MKKSIAFLCIAMAIAAFMASPSSVLRANSASSSQEQGRHALNRDRGVILLDGLELKNGPYIDSAVIGILQAGDRFKDGREVQNQYRKIIIEQSQNKGLQGLEGWVDRTQTSLQ